MKQNEIKVGSLVRDKSGYIRAGEIVSFLPNSRTKVIVRDIDRGAGWSEKEQRYVGVHHSTTDASGAVVGQSWGRGHNFTYGVEFERHIDKLELMPSDAELIS